MHHVVRVLAAALAILVAGCSARSATAPADTNLAAIEQAAHGTYVAAIDRNNVDTLMADLTDDIVYQAPRAPQVVGRAAVRKWAADYVGAYHTNWQKTAIGSTVSGDGAFER